MNNKNTKKNYDFQQRFKSCMILLWWIKNDRIILGNFPYQVYAEV